MTTAIATPRPAASPAKAAPVAPDRARIVGADGLRALACLWVLGHHATQSLNLPVDGPFSFFRRHGAMGVGVFFVLSGLLLSVPFWKAYQRGDGPPDLRRYAKARLARIVPGYYLCLLVTFLFLGSYTPEGTLRLASALAFINPYHWRTYLPVPVNAALWSIGVEMAFYAMLPLWALGLFRLRRRVSAPLYCALSFAVLVVAQYALVRLLPSPTLGPDPTRFERLAAHWLPVRNPLGLFAHFLFGTMAGYLITAWPRPIDRPTSAAPGRLNRFDALCACLVGLLVLDLYLDAMLHGRLPAWLDAIVEKRHLWFMDFGWPLFPLLVAALLLAMPRSRRFGAWMDNRFLRLTATLSFGIYLWHMVVLYAVKAAWPGLPAAGPGAALEYTALCAALTYGVAALSYFALEKPVLDHVREGNAARHLTSSVR